MTEVATLVIDETLLSGLAWGHAGEAFLIPFLALTPLPIAAILARLRSNNAKI